MNAVPATALGSYGTSGRTPVRRSSTSPVTYTVPATPNNPTKRPTGVPLTWGRNTIGGNWGPPIQIVTGMIKPPTWMSVGPTQKPSTLGTQTWLGTGGEALAPLSNTGNPLTPYQGGGYRSAPTPTYVLPSTTYNTVGYPTGYSATTPNSPAPSTSHTELYIIGGAVTVALIIGYLYDRRKHAGRK